MKNLDTKKNKKKLKKLEKLDVEVEEMSSDDILAIVAEIEKTSKVKLEELLKEADVTGKGDILREKWKQDVTDRLDFIKDQKKNYTGARGNRWSTITIRMGLKSEYSERPGEIVSRLKEEYDMYQLRKKEAKAQGKKAPLGEGALIFDEVKVRAKLQWNSSDNSLVGYGFNVRYIPLA
ncbi:uncharacterized protein LOC135336868 [Halichondria panicea]|uniref:uncharacterized protein LOC135336868 n=1 Tax=Halichondria panicea TaxID=6063 RepID=UPI00312B51FE